MPMGPPKALVAPKPMSSMRMMTTFGAPVGRPEGLDGRVRRVLRVHRARALVRYVGLGQRDAVAAALGVLRSHRAIEPDAEPSGSGCHGGYLDERAPRELHDPPPCAARTWPRACRGRRHAPGGDADARVPASTRVQRHGPPTRWVSDPLSPGTPSGGSWRAIATRNHRNAAPNVMGSSPVGPPISTLRAAVPRVVRGLAMRTDVREPPPSHRHDAPPRRRQHLPPASGPWQLSAVVSTDHRATQPAALTAAVGACAKQASAPPASNTALSQ